MKNSHKKPDRTSDILIKCPHCNAFYLHVQEVKACALENPEVLFKTGQAVRFKLPDIVGLDGTFGQVRGAIGSVLYQRNPENKLAVRGFQFTVYSFKAERDLHVFFDQIEAIAPEQVKAEGAQAVVHKGLEISFSDVQVKVNQDQIRRDDLRRGKRKDDEIETKDDEIETKEQEYY
ncbi:hypothetical protein KJ969_02570 [Patescibacteria group bacterium]|nr:hypothetical protein [Patescibacteria group bacterium]MBU1922379.1 hypothetical protein [Patescibacteria group bacterium]